ncbi:MAG TPA: PAS domain-containing sensor histidine kinase [Methanocella sp.]|nr:PAS domain-containing sensor histidine kinase [Methanocella sp.]
MKGHDDRKDEIDDLREKIIGLGERSYRKSYYPELQNRLADLERFKTLLDQSNDAIFLAEIPSGKITDVNETAVLQIGYSKDEFERMTLYDVIIDKHDDLRELFSGEIKSLVLESAMNRKNRDGTVYETAMRIVHFRDRGYIVAVARNVTARKEAEKELMQAKSQSELYLDLMGHDINNMNQAAIGFLEMAIERLRPVCQMAPGDEQLLYQAIEDMQNSASLIDNVRKLQKVQTRAFEPIIIEVGKILQEIKKSMPDGASREVRVGCVQDCECYVKANELLKDVFTNLVDNAIKHSSGPVRVDIKLAEDYIAGRKYCKVVIEDDGPGIPDKMKLELFDLRQLGEVRISGKGLGLYIVRTLVNDYRGLVWVENRIPGDYRKGSKFIVMLPAVDKPA